MFELERSLLWGSRASIFALVIVPIIVTSSMLFPFVSGKNFFFRLVMGLGIACWVALAILNEKYRPKKHLLLGALGTFIGVTIVAALLGADPYHSFWSNFERMDGVITYIYLFGLFLVAATTFNTKKLWVQLFGASVVVSIVSAVWGLLQSTGAVAMVVPGRPYAGFGNSIYLAVYLLFHTFILGLVFTKTRVSWQRVLIGMIFVLEFYVFLLSASRGAFIGAIAGLLATTLIVAIFYRSEKAMFIFGGALALAIFIVILVVAFPNSGIVQNVTLLDRLSDIPFSDISRDARIMVWGVGWDAYLARPILGWGPGNFIIPFAEFYNPNLFGQEPWFDRTHNMFLEWLVTTGFVGFLSYIMVIATAFFSIYKLHIKNKIDVITGAFLTGFFVTYLVQNIFVFDTIGTYIVIFLFWSLLYAFNNFDEAAERREEISIPSTKLFGAALGGIVIVVITFSINVKPILASQQLIDGLQAFPERKPAAEVIKKFDKALAFDTFANTEVRERFASVVFDLSRNLGEFSAQFLQINDKAIEYFEQERIDRPEQLRNVLFLAQLQAIKSAATNADFEKAEGFYVEAAERAPKYVQTHLSLASLYLIQGKHEEAISQVQKVEKLDIQISGIVPVILRTYISAGDLDGGILFLNEFFSGEHYGHISPTNLDPTLIDATTKFSPARQLELFNIIEEILSENSESGKVILYLVTAQAHGELGNFDRAEEYANRAGEFESPYSGQIEEFLQSIKALRG